MILYLRYCRTGVLFHITVHVKDQYVTTYDDVILVKPNRILHKYIEQGLSRNRTFYVGGYVKRILPLYRFLAVLQGLGPGTRPPNCGMLREQRTKLHYTVPCIHL